MMILTPRFGGFCGNDGHSRKVVRLPARAWNRVPKGVPSTAFYRRAKPCVTRPNSRRTHQKLVSARQEKRALPGGGADALDDHRLRRHVVVGRLAGGGHQ